MGLTKTLTLQIGLGGIWHSNCGTDTKYTGTSGFIQKGCSSKTYELRLLLLQHTRINRHAVEKTHGWQEQVLYSLVQY